MPFDLAAEAERMAWAVQYYPVPEALACGHDDAGSWFVTAALPGGRASSARRKADPAYGGHCDRGGLAGAARGTARTPVPVPLERRGARCRRPGGRRPTGGLTQRPGTRATGHSPPIPHLSGPPRSHHPTSSWSAHGDACAPNTLLAADGRWSGHVDLGLLGIADRWADGA